MDDAANAGDIHDRPQQLNGMGLGTHDQHAMQGEIHPLH
jgi:hypothetical protein